MGPRHLVAGVGASVSGLTPDLATLDAGLARVRAAGGDWAELSMPGLHLLAGGRDLADRSARAAATCAAHGMGYSVHAPIAVNFMDAAHAGLHAAVLEATIAFAGRIGARVVVIHPGRVPPNVDAADRVRLLAAERDAVRRAADLAGRAGLRLGMENLNPDRTMMAGVLTSYALDPRALADQVAAIAHPAVCGTLDFGHGWLAARRLGFDYGAALRAFAPVVGHLHVTDNCGLPMTYAGATEDDYVAYGMGDLHLPIGWGTVPYGEVLDDLPIRAGTALVLEMKGCYVTELVATLAVLRRFATRLEGVGEGCPGEEPMAAAGK